MPSTLMTPGVYIEEKNAFPGSAVAVATAVPVFIGYTETADRNGKSLLYKPTRITSFAEYKELFGDAFNPKFTVAPPAAGDETFVLNGTAFAVTAKADNTAYFYNSMRLFFANGGSTCYVLAVGTYQGKDSVKVDAKDYLQSPANETVFEILKKEYEPTLIVMPDAIVLGPDCYTKLYVAALMHCAESQSRFAIFDLRKQTIADTTDAVVAEFRTAIGTTSLNYGAAYYPWLNSAIIDKSDVDYTNFDGSVDDLIKLLPAKVKDGDEGSKIADIQKQLTAGGVVNAGSETTFHQSMMAVSPSYVSVLEEIRSHMNLLPPSAAMAGIYTLVDNGRGVWKAPANVSVSMVNSPSLNISHDAQQNLNVDVIGGKSINVIRPFPGLGTLVWGARTLDGNSQDWRYINVRRTLIMIEQSLKLATRAYVFEPNDSSTWVTVSSMMDNFLVNLWKQGALAGAVPEQAFSVQVGLGSTMTPNDILDGIMRITVKLAIVRPAEFIVITFQQQQQQS
ncbi:phage tail sheath family protein [Chitinophagaceae bacterium LWZ2-11]